VDGEDSFNHWAKRVNFRKRARTSETECREGVRESERKRERDRVCVCERERERDREKVGFFHTYGLLAIIYGSLL